MEALAQLVYGYTLVHYQIVDIWLFSQNKYTLPKYYLLLTRLLLSTAPLYSQ